MELKYQADENYLCLMQEYWWSPINRYYNMLAYCAVLKKVIKEAKQSYYNIPI